MRLWKDKLTRAIQAHNAEVYTLQAVKKEQLFSQVLPTLINAGTVPVTLGTAPFGFGIERYALWMKMNSSTWVYKVFKKPYLTRSKEDILGKLKELEICRTLAQLFNRKKPDSCKEIRVVESRLLYFASSGNAYTLDNKLLKTSPKVSGAGRAVSNVLKWVPVRVSMPWWRACSRPCSKSTTTAPASSTPIM